MYTVIVSDIFTHHISPILYSLDLYHLSVCCKLFFQNIKIDIKKNAINHIEKQIIELSGDKYDKFKSFLNEHDAMISGSMIINAIVGMKHSNDLLNLVIFTEGYVYNYTSDDFGLKFIQEIDPSSQQINCIGDTTVSFIKTCDKILIHLVNKQFVDHKKKTNIENFCYKFDNQLSISNLQTLLIKQIDIKFIADDFESMLAYHNYGFKFYDDKKILLNEDLFRIFTRNRPMTKIKKCKFNTAECKYTRNTKIKYYAIIGNWYVTSMMTIIDCDFSNKCFVHVLSPNTKHFHDHSGNDIFVVVK
jgi:hypothetical protein